MQELKFRNLIPSLFAFIVAVAAATGSSYITVRPFDLPVPLLIIGLFAGYLTLNVIAYPKATTTQILQLTITGVFINAIVLFAAIFGIKYFNLASITFNSDFIISINPLTPALSFLFSFITLISLVLFEDKTNKSKKQQDQKEKSINKQLEDTQPETISFEGNKISESDKEKNEVISKTEENPVSLYEELYPQTKTENQNTEKPQETEFFFSLNEKEQENKINTNEAKPLESKDEFMEIESLPLIDFEENKQEQKTSPSPSSNDNNESFDFIPADIRLIEAPVSKDNESKGKIASIGKLLVNNRDIEGVIESGAAIAEAGAENKTNIVSSVSGEHIYEKFNQLKQESAHMKEIALIDKGGFILASNYEDKMKIHITGALIAGAFHTLQNYLSQISFNQPQKIFFETENSNNFIMKTNDEFLFSICDKEFKQVDYTALEGFMENETISQADLTPLIELNQIKNFAISDGAGKLIKSASNSENSEKLAIISSALFENLKVFLMNIQLMKLTKITIFNSEEVITIQKFDNEIASFITPIEGIIKISDDFIKIEEIYQV